MTTPLRQLAAALATGEVPLHLAVRYADHAALLRDWKRCRDFDAMVDLVRPTAVVEGRRARCELVRAVQSAALAAWLEATDRVLRGEATEGERWDAAHAAAFLARTADAAAGARIAACPRTTADLRAAVSPAPFPLLLAAARGTRKDTET